MPIIPSLPLRRLSQEEFAPVAFDVMRQVFDIHNKFGKLFDERIYKKELARRLPGTRLEVPVDVVFESFARRYYLDVLIGDGALFEFKSAERLTGRHRAQSMHYLLLTDLAHAKLINTGAEAVEHEFVNTSLTRRDRLQFDLTTFGDFESAPGGSVFRSILEELLHDWGVGLELTVYAEALTHFLGGAPSVWHDVVVLAGETELGVQQMPLAAPGAAFMLTALTERPGTFAEHARRVLGHTQLETILWANLTLHSVTLTALRR